MTADGRTRQVEVERAAVTAMYARLDAALTGALAEHARTLAVPVETAEDLYQRDVRAARLARVAEGLRAAEHALCFGRIDAADGRCVHVGRLGLRSDDGAVLLVDWRADAARPFYAATAVAPLGLRRRRHLRLDGRRVVDVSDEILDGSAPTEADVVGDGPLVAALERARTGRMREAVATLQTEQDLVVRSSHQGVTVVDGGPGTGKTIVALHRAAYVLYAFPRVVGRGVLVVGPNRRFLDYISEVLPSLGENDVRMATHDDLGGVAATAAEPDAVARVKGEAAAGEALARWVGAQRRSGVPLRVRVGQETVVLPASAVDDVRRRALRGGRAHNPARAEFTELVVEAVVSALERRAAEELAQLDAEVAAVLGVDLDRAVAKDLRSLGLDAAPGPTGPEIDWDAVRDGLLDDPEVDRAVGTVWPRLDPQDVLRRFLAGYAPVQEALAALPAGAGPAGDGYTRGDLALLDEARALVDGEPEDLHGHVVVDEAQELTQMQWRMIMRRCPARSLTVVGDFAQSGSPTTVESWAQALEPFVEDRFEHHTLTVNYRTTAQILAAARPLLTRIAPGQAPSRSIRQGEPPREVRVPAADVGAAVRRLVVAAADEHPGDLVGVVAASGRVARLGEALDGTAAVVVAAAHVRGLEFDEVFVVDPDGVEAARPSGARDLYVALTRATRRLCIVRVDETGAAPVDGAGGVSTA